jgi:hypothetical protein
VASALPAVVAITGRGRRKRSPRGTATCQRNARANSRSGQSPARSATPNPTTRAPTSTPGFDSCWPPMKAGTTPLLELAWFHRWLVWHEAADGSDDVRRQAATRHQAGGDDPPFRACTCRCGVRDAPGVPVPVLQDVARRSPRRRGQETGMTQWPKARPTAAKRAPAKRQPRKVQTHVFLNGGQVDHAGVGICADCGHLRNSPVHDLTVVSAEVEAIDRRILGEGGGAA